jgi:hypothetical protein
VTQVSPSTFVIASTPSDANITFGSETTMINTHETGAVEVKIPCHCSLRMIGREPLEPSLECMYDMQASTLLHILPPAGSVVDSGYFEAQVQHDATFENMTDILNHQRKLYLT